MSDFSDLDIMEKNIESLRDNLLDMSLRNNLLNFKPLKKSIMIYNENLVDLFDILVLQEKSMEFLSNDLMGDIISDENSLELDYGEHYYKDSSLQTNHDFKDLKKRLSSLYSENKLSLEEQGYNTLFLALGFLNWTEVGYSDNINKAPLILIPVQMFRSSVSAPYKIKWNGEDIKYNLSLQYKLQEQGLDLPKFEEFEGKKDVYDYFKKVEEQINNFPDWNVTNNSYLSKFSFKKHIMFEDLKLENWNDLQNSGVKNLFGLNDKDYDFNQDSDFDSDLKDSTSSLDYYNVLDADSSQLEVLNEVKKGKNLVVEGPPGTGKSQTIVNIIAELLANDKKVLFVCEKKAALDVVKSRLDDIGLGDACLELHGKNSNKKELLKELKRTLESDSFKVKDYQSFQNLDEIKEELNQYVELNHLKYGKTELTPYDLMGMLELYSQKLEKNGKIIDINMDNLENVDKQQRGEIINNLKELFSIYELISPISKSPWAYTSSSGISTKDVKESEKKFKELFKCLNNFEELNEDIYNLSGIKSDTLNITSMVANSKIIDLNMKLFKNNDDRKELEKLIDDIILFQSITKDMDLSILDMGFESIDQISEFNNVMSDLDVNYRILEDFDLYATESDFKNFKETIDNSNLKPLLNEDLIYKLNLFKELDQSFIKRNFGKKYKNLKKEFSFYYDYDVTSDNIIKDLENLIKLNEQLSDLRKKIMLYYNVAKDDDVILLDIGVLKDWIDDLDLIKLELKDYKLNLRSFNKKYGSKDLKKLKELKDKINDSTLGKYYFGELWKGHESNSQEITSLLNNLNKFNELYDDGYFNDETLNCIKNDNVDELRSLIAQLSNNNEKIFELHDFLNNKLNFGHESGLKSINNYGIEDLKEKLQFYLENIDDLINYRLFEKNSIKYSNDLTEDLINALKNDEIDSEEILISLFYYNFSNILLEQVFSDFPVLDEFNYKIHENKIEEFKQLDTDSLKLNQYRINEKLSIKRPNINFQVAPNSSLGILKKELSKKGRIMPIRKLLSKTKGVISSIKPCFMMSPLSIAQFLSPENFESYFDYIIFDEASQIKVEDAIGAMFRGKNYVVMGDTKQLPPTTFFESELDGYDDEENYTQDLESILHLCKNTFNTKMLKWHYRSRHESLIMVSNQEFYDNKLYVFPSPIKTSDDLGLKFEYDSSTVYDRGNARNNIKEAENIVDYAIKCVEKYDGKKSIGIGTFSSSQRNTIEDILEKKLEENPALEKFFNKKGVGEFFIKNLENIQGDERDIILISMGYGKDLNGKLYMNFGPLNGNGGERRLNVLITRAREQCVIFSNFKSSDLYVTEKTSVGVKALKTFLYYAEKREFPNNYHTGEDFDSDFEKSVYDFLTDEGYLVEKQVGCAGYKIDLAIVDKENADEYILAIECDGATYHSSSSARDRDKLRQQVLENLGWKFYRVWSTDWYHSRNRAKKRLLDAINEVIQYKENEETAKVYESDYKTDELSFNQSIIEDSVIRKSNDDKFNAQFDKYFQNYYFCYGDNGMDLKNYVGKLIEVEGPIHIEEIYNRLRDTYDKRLSKTFKNEINQIILNMLDKGEIIHKNNFYYPIHQNNIQKVRIRVSPKIDYIAADEIDLAIVYTLKLQFETRREDLIKSVSKNLGFKKVYEKIKDKIGGRIDSLIDSHVLVENLDVIDLKKQ